MNTNTKLTALVSTILLTSALAGPANADTPSTASLEKVPTEATQQLAVVKADATSHISFERTAITTIPAPAVEAVYAPVTAQRSTVEAKPTAPVQGAPTGRHAAPTPSVAPTPVAPAGTGRGAALLASAYSQIGITQDCTRMVENALASIGIISGDLAPAQFFQFGSVVGTPAPGDILISSGHVGIYAGNGMMISGGFNGSQTVLHPVSYVGAYSAVRV
jgi:cell wall-associated NlpC family hydrolase